MSTNFFVSVAWSPVRDGNSKTFRGQTSHLVQSFCMKTNNDLLNHSVPLTMRSKGAPCSLRKKGRAPSLSSAGGSAIWTKSGLACLKNAFMHVKKWSEKVKYAGPTLPVLCLKTLATQTSLRPSAEANSTTVIFRMTSPRWPPPKTKRQAIRKSQSSNLVQRDDGTLFGISSSIELTTLLVANKLISLKVLRSFGPFFTDDCSKPVGGCLSSNFYNWTWPRGPLADALFGGPKRFLYNKAPPLSTDGKWAPGPESRWAWYKQLWWSQHRSLINAQIRQEWKRTGGSIEVGQYCWIPIRLVAFLWTKSRRL